MIAKNFIKYPEALRFQKELFAKTFGRHYTILSRLVQCVCTWKDKAPEWVIEAADRSRQLVKFWKGKQVEVFDNLNQVCVSY